MLIDGIYYHDVAVLKQAVDDAVENFTNGDEAHPVCMTTYRLANKIRKHCKNRKDMTCLDNYQKSEDCNIPFLDVAIRGYRNTFSRLAGCDTNSAIQEKLDRVEDLSRSAFLHHKYAKEYSNDT